MYYQLAQLIFNLKTIKKLKKLKYNFILNNKLVNFEKIIDFYFKEYQTNNIKRFTNKKKHRNSLIQLFYNLLKFLYNFKNYFFVFIFNYKKIFLLNGASKEIKNFIKIIIIKVFFLKNNYSNSNNYNHGKDFQNYCHKIFSKFGLVDKESKTLIEKITADFCNFSNHYYSIANSLKQIKNTNFFVRGSPNILIGFFLSSLKKKNKIYSYSHGNESLFPFYKTLETSEFIFSNFHVVKSKFEKECEEKFIQINSEFLQNPSLIEDKPNYYKKMIENFSNQLIYEKKTKKF